MALRYDIHMPSTPSSIQCSYIHVWYCH
jgi:hypothetical protein